MADAFISYQRADQPKARAIAEALEACGYSVWWDLDLLPGEKFRHAIAKIIHSSRAAIVIWSPQSVGSDFVLDEANMARHECKLIPIRWGDVELPIGFGSLHTHDLTTWDGQSFEPFEPILKSVERFAGKPATPVRAETFTVKPRYRARLTAAFLRWKHDFLWTFVQTVVLFLLISAAAFVLPTHSDPRVVFREMVKLVHIYTGMIILGGGVFLLLLFRLATGFPTYVDRSACINVGRKLAVSVWLPAALLQPFIGLGMLYTKSFSLEFTTEYFPRWLLLSLVLYAAALSSWIAGFHAAGEAVREDGGYGDAASQAIEFKRDVLLGVAFACTLAIYCLMVYREQFQGLFEG
jgi:hypothetical protein